MKDGFVPYGLSSDKPTAQANWKKKHNLPFNLLCDPKLEAIKAFGMGTPVNYPLMRENVPSPRHLTDSRRRVKVCLFREALAHCRRERGKSARHSHSDQPFGQRVGITQNCSILMCSYIRSTTPSDWHMMTLASTEYLMAIPYHYRFAIASYVNYVKCFVGYSSESVNLKYSRRHS